MNTLKVVYEPNTTITVLADVSKGLCIKDDQSLVKHGVKAWSVHSIYKLNDWQLGSFICGFCTLKEASEFVGNKGKGAQ